MDWIFWNHQEKELERKSEQIDEILKRKVKELKELMDFTTIGSKLASEEEIEYWQAHLGCKGKRVHESRTYRNYRIKNLVETINWCYVKLKELEDPKEIQENRLKLKKNQ